jgi:hypothetical protein
MMVAWTIILYAALLLSSVEESTSFAPVAFGGLPHEKSLTKTAASKLVLAAKKMRRRKTQPTGAIAPDPIKVSKEQLEGLDRVEGLDEDQDDNVDDVDDVKGFELKPDDIAKGECESRLQ